jgi:hypothetical protein
MKPFSTIVYETLMTAGIERGRTAIREALVNKGPALSTMASSGGVVADTPEQEGDLMCPPIGRQGGWQPMGISGKGPRVNASAKFIGLRVVVDNSRNWRTQAPRVAPLGVRQFLVLVQ